MGEEHGGSIVPEVATIFLFGMIVGMVVGRLATYADSLAEPTTPSQKVLVDPYECQTVYAPDTTKLLFCTTNTNKD